jgi:hypothetical protein
MGVSANRPKPWPWLLLSVLATMLAVVVAAIRVDMCPDPGECEVVMGGGPVGWVVLAVCVLVVVVSRKRAFGGPRTGPPAR